MNEFDLNVDTYDVRTEFDSASQPTSQLKADVLKRSAIYAALANNEGDPISLYQQIKGELDSFGESPTIERTRVSVQERKDEEYRQLVTEVMYTDPEKGANAVQDYVTIKSLQEPANLKAEALENAALSTLDRRNDNIAVQRTGNYLSGLHGRLRVQEAISRAFDREISESSTDNIDIGADFLDMMLPGQQVVLANAAKDILGTDYSMKYNVMAGDMIADLGEWIRNHPVNQQEMAAQQVVEAIKNHSGVLADNDMMKVFTLAAVKEYSLEAKDQTQVDWGKVVSNALGIIELAGILPAKSVARLAAYYAKGGTARAMARPAQHATVNVITDANPQMGAEIQAAAMVDETGQVADALNTTRAELAANALPQPILPDVHLAGAPPEVVNIVERLRNQASAAMDVPDNTFVFTDKDFASRMDNIRRTLNRVEGTYYYHPDKFRIARDPNSNKIDYEAVMGQDELYGFADYEQAYEAVGNAIRAMDKPDIGDLQFDVLMKDPQTGFLVEAVPGELTEYFVKFKGQYEMAFSDIVPGLDGVKPVGQINKFLLDPKSIFAPEIDTPFVIANERKALIKHDLFALADPFHKLPYQSKRKVNQYIAQGDAEGKLYQPEELIREGFTTKEIDGYYSVRTFWDSVYRLKNKEIRSDLVQEGFKRINILDKDGKTLVENGGRVFTPDNLPPIKEVFDPLNKERITLNDTEISRIYNLGGSVVRLLKPLETGHSQYHYIVVRRPADIQELPDNVIGYRPGYVFRMNIEPFYVDEYSNVRVDGELVKNHRRTIGAARSREEADRMVAELQAQADAEGLTGKVRYDHRIDRNIKDVKSYLDSELTLLRSDLAYWFNKRGNRLKRSDESLGGIEDPIKAMERQANSIATVVSHREIVSSMMARLQKTYPEFFSWDQNDKMYRYIGMEMDEAANPNLKRANTLYRHIDAFRTTATEMDKRWRNLMIDMEYYFSKMGMSKIGSKIFLENLAHTTPGKIATGTTFNLTLALKPLEQAILQGATGLHLTGLNPVAAPLAFKDATFLMNGFAMYGTKAWPAYKQVVRAGGFSPEEFEEIFKAFRKTGKAYSIDSNLYINEANFRWSRRLPETQMGRVGNVLSNVAKSPFMIGKAIGFDVGEMYNQAITWSFARRHWESLHPGRKWNESQHTLDEIAGMARNYSFDMTKTGQLPYQKGALATMTQFMAINHKAALMLLPEKMGGNLLLKGNRGKYVLGVLAMYGLSGVDMDGVYKWALEDNIGVELDKETRDILMGGILETSLNYALDMATNEPMGTNKAAWSERLSASSDAFSFALDFGKAIITGDKSMLEILAGPSGKAFPNVGKAAKAAAHMWAYERTGDTIDDVVSGIDEFTDYFGSKNSLRKYRAAIAWHKKIEEMYDVDNRLMPTAPTTKGELIAKLLAGVQARSVEEIYDMYKEGKKAGGGGGKEIEDDAKWFVERMTKIYLETEDNYIAEKKIRRLASMMFHGDESYGFKVMELAKGKYFDASPNYEQFVKKFLNNYVVMNPDHNEEQAMRAIDVSNAIPNEMKEKAKENVKSLYREIRFSDKVLQETKFGAENMGE